MKTSETHEIRAMENARTIKVQCIVFSSTRCRMGPNTINPYQPDPAPKNRTTIRSQKAGKLIAEPISSNNVVVAAFSMLFMNFSFSIDCGRVISKKNPPAAVNFVSVSKNPAILSYNIILVNYGLFEGDEA